MLGDYVDRVNVLVCTAISVWRFHGSKKDFDNLELPYFIIFQDPSYPVSSTDSRNQIYINVYSMVRKIKINNTS